MEVIVKRFINYLFEFGMVGMKTIKIILSTYESNKNVVLYSKSLKEEDKLKLIFSEYLKNLTGGLTFSTPEKLNFDYDTSSISNCNSSSLYLLDFLSEDVVAKFKENTKIEKIKKIKNMFKFYKFYSKVKIMKAFVKFRDNTIVIKRSFANLKSSSCSRNKGKIIENAEKSDFISNSTLNGGKLFPSSSMYLTKKQEDDLINCTFKPNKDKKKNTIDCQYQYNPRPEEIFTRLYDEFKLLKNKKEIIKEKKDKEEEKKYNFNPVSYRKKDEKVNNNSENISIDFLQRQAHYQNKSSKEKDLLIREEEEKFENIYPFKPRINSTGRDLNNQSKNEDRFEKLYELGRNRRRSCDFENNHNHTERQSPNRSLNFDKINSLYNDYKNKNSKIREILKNVEMEQGITFKPNLISGNKYKVDSTFHERNIAKKGALNNIESKSISSSNNLGTNIPLNPSIPENSKNVIVNVNVNYNSSKCSKSTNLSRNSSKSKLKVQSRNISKNRKIEYNNAPSIENSFTINNFTNSQMNNHNYNQSNNNASNVSNKINSIAGSTISHKDLVNFTLNADGSLRNSGSKQFHNKEILIEEDEIQELPNQPINSKLKFRSSTLKNLVEEKYI